MNGFEIQVNNRILDPKHVENMGAAIWLFMWFLDRMTSIDSEGVGKVLGGKPITYPEVKEALGISNRTYTRWVDILRSFGYIETLRTPSGLVVRVNKAKKRYAKSGRSPKSDTPKMSSDTPKVAHRYANNGRSNIRLYRDYTKTIGEIVEEKDNRGKESPQKERIRALLKQGSVKELKAQ